MTRTVTFLIVSVLIFASHTTCATDFSLVTTLGGAFDLDFNPISTDTAMNATEPVIWQVDFGVRVENLSSEHAGFGALAFSIVLEEASDAFDMGWQPYNPSVSATTGLPGSLNPLFMTNMDAGVSAHDKTGILVHIAPHLNDHSDPRRSIGQAPDAPSRVGSLFVMDVPSAASRISVEQVEFSGINLDGTFFRAGDGYGQSTMTLPRGPDGATLINVSTANAPPAQPEPVNPPVVPAIPPVVELPEIHESNPELPEVSPEPVEVPEPATLPPVVQAPGVVEPSIPEDGGAPVPLLPDDVFHLPDYEIVDISPYLIPEVIFRPDIESGWSIDGSWLIRFQPHWPSISLVDVVQIRDFDALSIDFMTNNTSNLGSVVAYSAEFGNGLAFSEPDQIRVPEPACALLIAIGGVATALRRRR